MAVDGVRHACVAPYGRGVTMGARAENKVSTLTAQKAENGGVLPLAADGLTAVVAPRRSDASIARCQTSL